MTRDLHLRRAFTIAEVLITLAIIGVVAEMTIPSLISSYQKTQYVVGLKKAYSEVNQVLLAMTNDYGLPGDLKATGLFAEGTNSVTFGDSFVKYFKVVKNCGISTDQNCWPDQTFVYYNKTPSDSININNITNQPEIYYKFTTADGMSFLVMNNASWGGSYVNCGYDISTGATGNLKQRCGSVYVDINGRQGPNVYGRDTFFFYITNGRGPVLYPNGGEDDQGGWWKTHAVCNASSTIGTACAARVIEQGWQMNY